MDENDIPANCTPEERKHALVSKPRWQQFLMKAMPALSWPLLLFADVYFINPGLAYSTKFQSVSESAALACKAMFGQMPLADFAAGLHLRVAGCNLLAFSFSLYLILMIFLLPFSMLSQFMAGKGPEKVKQAITTVSLLVLSYLYCWKIPLFIASFFSWSAIFRYSADAMLGIFLVCFIAYILFVGVARRSNPQ